MVSATFAIFLAAAALQAQTPVPTPQGSTPAACLQEVRDYVTSRQKVRPMTDALARELNEARSAMLKTCVGRFDPHAVPADQLRGLIDLYTDAAEWDRGVIALDRALAAHDGPAAARADLLAAGVRFCARPPKSPTRLARADKYMAELDGMADALEQRIAAHTSLNSYYRWDDVDAEIMRHSSWLMETARTASPALRTKFGRSFVTAYLNAAQVLAGRGENERALDLLQRRLPAEVPEAADAAQRAQPYIDRYRLVGTPGAPIAAPRWLNVSHDTKAIDVKGAVTLLEFTAHWCTPCKESYPGIKRLIARYAPRGLRVVLATELYGYFGTDRGLSAADEFERDRTYFSEEGLSVPIAVADRPSASRPNPNDHAYKVGGVPQIYLLDRRGTIRLIMIGYDDANEEKLGALIERLLDESTSTPR